MHLWAKLHFQSFSLWIRIAWLNIHFAKSTTTAQNWNLWPGYIGIQTLVAFGIFRDFRKSSEEFRRERTRGQRIASVDLEKNGGKAPEYESKQEQQTVTLVEIHYVYIIRTADSVKGESIISRKCEKSKFLVRDYIFFTIYHDRGK